MTTEQLPEPMNMAVAHIEELRGIIATRYADHTGEVHPSRVRRTEMEVASCDEAIDAIRDEHAQRVTMQHHACDLAQRVAELEAEVKRLSPSEDDIRYTAEQDWSGLSGAVAWHLADRHGDGWAGIGDMMEAWRDAEVRRVTAELEAAR